MKRRELLKFSLASFGTALVANKAVADSTLMCKLGLTPQQTEGPFYPQVRQVDEDADLVLLNGRPSAAKGEVILVQGIVTDQNCLPVRGVLVEIWQACESGRYNHKSDPNPAPLDPNFQYWGKAVTDDLGAYRFRTIVPGAYPADRNWIRPPHIHFKVSRVGYKELITQMYFSGQRYNESDLILKELPKAEQQKVIIPLESIADLPHPVANFDIQIKKIGG